MIRLHETWMGQAACRGLDPNMFFPEEGVSARGAKNICFEQCPVRLQCLEYGLKERGGIWGGFTHKERVKIKAQIKKEGRKGVFA